MTAKVKTKFNRATVCKTKSCSFPQTSRSNWSTGLPPDAGFPNVEATLYPGGHPRWLTLPKSWRGSVVGPATIYFGAHLNMKAEAAPLQRR